MPLSTQSSSNPMAMMIASTERRANHSPVAAEDVYRPRATSKWSVAIASTVSADAASAAGGTRTCQPSQRS